MKRGCIVALLIFVSGCQQFAGYDRVPAAVAGQDAALDAAALVGDGARVDRSASRIEAGTSLREASSESTPVRDSRASDSGAAHEWGVRDSASAPDINGVDANADLPMTADIGPVDAGGGPVLDAEPGDLGAAPDASADTTHDLLSLSDLRLLDGIGPLAECLDDADCHLFECCPNRCSALPSNLQPFCIDNYCTPRACVAAGWIDPEAYCDKASGSCKLREK